MNRRSILTAGPLAALAALVKRAEAQAQPPILGTNPHFSYAELDSLRHAYAAAVSNVRAAVVINPKAAALRLRAERDTGAVALALSGGYPERPRASDGREITRADQLAAAKFHRDRALADSLPAALKAVEGHPNRKDWVESANHLRDAIGYLEGVDLSLDYADPTPQDFLPGQTVPAVVGPHGEFWDAIAQAFWMSHYARDMMDQVNKLLNSPAYYGKRTQLRNVLGLYKSALIWQFDCAAKIVGVSFTENEDRFCSTLYVADTLTNAVGSAKPGLPEHYFAMLLQLQELLPEDVKPLFRAFGDMWRRTDDVSWGLFVFKNDPQKTRCA